MNESFFSPCPRGLEPVLSEELERLGAHEIEIVPGGTSYRGDWSLAWRANLESRIATRVLWRVGSGRYRSEDDLYRIAYALPWAQWFQPSDTLRVNVTARKSPLRSLEFATLRIKDAICDHFRSARGSRPSIDTVHPSMRAHAFLSSEECTLYLDTSGEPLYKRGFKEAKVEAPLKENLAAGILALSGWTPEQALCDPMCGSGTFLLEAAQIALDIAPGLGRGFAFERLRFTDLPAWESLRAAAQARAAEPRPLAIFGSDLVPTEVGRARSNLDGAGLAACVTLDRADFLERLAPAESGILVCNPPYGVRLGETEDLARFYPLLGDTLKARWSGWNAFFFSADTALNRHIGLRASRKTPLFNGALECRLYEYRMVRGSLR